MRRLARTTAALAAVAATAAAAAGCSTGASASAATQWYPAGHRVAVTGVVGETLDGTRFSLDRWRGHVVVVNFWGSWCGPCEGEAAALAQVAHDTRSEGVRFLGVDIRDDRASAQAFVATHHVGYPNLFDEANAVALRFRGVAPNATPTTIVLDRAGRIVARHSGAILYTELRDLVHRAVAEGGTA